MDIECSHPAAEIDDLRQPRQLDLLIIERSVWSMFSNSSADGRLAAASAQSAPLCCSTGPVPSSLHKPPLDMAFTINVADGDPLGRLVVWV